MTEFSDQMKVKSMLKLAGDFPLKQTIVYKLDESNGLIQSRLPYIQVPTGDLQAVRPMP